VVAVNAGGLVLIIAGAWVLTQVLGGDALGRLGVTGNATQPGTTGIAASGVGAAAAGAASAGAAARGAQNAGQAVAQAAIAGASVAGGG
jgi:hypothetical protein